MAGFSERRAAFFYARIPLIRAIFLSTMGRLRPRAGESGCTVPREFVRPVFWWIRFLFFSAVAVFFLEFGIEEMTRAYKVNNPHVFVGSFFSSSLIILISGTLLVGFIWRMVLRVKGEKQEKDHVEP